MNFINGLNLEQAEFAIKAIASVHALSLGMKFKEKVDLNEKYSVSLVAGRRTNVMIIVAI